MKWTIDTTNAPGKIQVNTVMAALTNLKREHIMKIKLEGIIGGAERRQTVGSFWIGQENEARPDVALALDELGLRFGWKVSRDNAGEIVSAIESALPALVAARPVVDKRETQAAVDEREAKQRAARDEQEAAAAAKRAAFVAAYGSGDQVTVQPGYMAVVAQLCFDDSDSMSDYFNRNAPLGPEFALMVIPKGREDETTARRALERFPLLAGQGVFEWKKEKYRMGHGNYLTGPGVDIAPELAGGRNYYGRGGLVNCGHWNIEFVHAYSDAKELPTFKGYPCARPTTEAPTAAPAPADAGQVIGGATVSENKEKAGIEIRFPSKPAASVLDALKSHGWRWSRFGGCWYHRADDATRAWVRQFLGAGTQGANKAGTAGTQETEPTGPDRFDMMVEDQMAAACGA